MTGIPDSEAQGAMGARLRAIRQALGLSQEDMAKTMGIGVTALSAWETGRNQIDIVKLARSAVRWGFTTDWVATGDLSGLRRELADKVDGLVAEETTPRAGRPRGPAKKGKTIMQAVVAIADGDGSLFAIDVIRHEGKNWLVPAWLENPAAGYKIPERIVCLDNLAHQAMPGRPPIDFLVNAPIPRFVLYGSDPLPPDSGFLVVHRPDVRVPIPRGIH